jgi:hypothetical protein
LEVSNKFTMDGVDLDGLSSVSTESTTVETDPASDSTMVGLKPTDDDNRHDVTRTAVNESGTGDFARQLDHIDFNGVTDHILRDGYNPKQIHNGSEHSAHFTIEATYDNGSSLASEVHIEGTHPGGSSYRLLATGIRHSGNDPKTYTVAWDTDHWTVNDPNGHSGMLTVQSPEHPGGAGKYMVSSETDEFTVSTHSSSVDGAFQIKHDSTYNTATGQFRGRIFKFRDDSNTSQIEIFPAVGQMYLRDGNGDAVKLYAESGELKTDDANGNTTTLS